MTHRSRILAMITVAIIASLPLATLPADAQQAQQKQQRGNTASLPGRGLCPDAV